MSVILILLISISGGDTLHFTLVQAVDYALENNPEIEQLELEYARAQTGVNKAISAFYPSISATGGYAYLTDVPVFQLDSMPIPMGQNENYSLQVSLQQVLFAWGKIYNAYKISDLGKEIAELKLVRKKQELRCAVSDAFYGLLVLEDMVQVSQKSLAQLKRHAQAVEERYKAGLVSQFDLLRARVQVSNLKPRVIKAEHGLNLAREGFKMLLGMDLTTDFTISGELKMVDEDFVLEELIDEALLNRIELKNLMKVKEIARLSEAIMRRSNLPVIVAGATYERKKPFSFTSGEWGSNVIFNIGFQFPIFTGFKNFYQQRDAALQLREAELALENLKKAIRLEVKKAHLNFIAAKEALLTAEKNVSQAEKAFEIIEKRYKNGLATNLEYMDAQLAAMQARTNYLSALKDYYSSKAEIQKAIGKEE